MKPTSVIPAKAGIQCLNLKRKHWIPAFAGMTEACQAHEFMELLS